MTKELVLERCRSNLNFGFRQWNFQNLPRFIETFEKIEQAVDETTIFSFEIIHLEDITLLCL